MDTHVHRAIAHFDAWARTYGEDRISIWFRFYQSLALSKLEIKEGWDFLDVGCGTGWAVSEAAKRLRAGKACGIDISPKMIEKATAYSLGIPNIEFGIGNAEAIPYPDDSFTSILCTFSFHHYEKPLQALCEMKRVMKRDGKLVILDAARDVSFAVWLQDRWRRYFEKSHFRYYRTSEMKLLLDKAELNLTREIVTIKKFLDHKKVFTGLMLVECAKSGSVFSRSRSQSRFSAMSF